MENLSPETFGIAGAENMDVAPNQLTCSQMVAQFCANNSDLCTASASGLMLKADVVQDFLEDNPQCAAHFNEPNPLPEPILNETPVQMETKDLFNIKSPNFLGGSNVHNLILIVLALLILVNTGGGNLLTAPLKAAKKAV